MRILLVLLICCITSCGIFTNVESEDLIGTWKFVEINDESTDIKNTITFDGSQYTTHFRSSNDDEDEIFMEFAGNYTLDGSTLILERAERIFLSSATFGRFPEYLDKQAHRIKFEDEFLHFTELSPKGNPIGSWLMMKISD